MAAKNLQAAPTKDQPKNQIVCRNERSVSALKKVGKAVLGPADQSPEAEAARMGKRRGPGGRFS